jgi:predicted  nucleic acid-binding Zn-ribbon protein
MTRLVLQEVLKVRRQVDEVDESINALNRLVDDLECAMGRLQQGQSRRSAAIAELNARLERIESYLDMRPR